MTKATHALAGAVFGAVGGYVWHRWVGCSTGACPIVANPYTSTIYGAVPGMFAALG